MGWAEEFDALLTREVLTKRERPPAWLWHYTSAAGMRGVLSGKAIWATHYRHTNDRREVVLAHEILKDVIRSVGGSLGGPAQFVCKRVEESYDTQAIWKLAHVYLSCFSQKKDDLGQWLTYADRSRGYALELGLQPALRLRETGGQLGVDVFRVLYDEGRFRQLAEKGIRRILELTGQAWPSTPENNRARLASIAHANIMQFAGSLHARLKDAGFAAEKEWRLVGLALKDLNPNFHTLRGTLVPYVEIPMCKDTARVRVREIMYGAALEPEPTEAALRQLLASLGYKDGEVKITMSPIPYRP